MKGALFIQSEYSLLESTLRLHSIFNQASKRGYDFLAISDTNNLYAAYKFFKLAKKYPEIKPIIGLKLHIFHLEKKTSVLLYAKNNEGYRSLVIISSLVQMKDDKRLDIEEFRPYLKDVIVVTTGYESDVDEAILNKDYDLAKQLIMDYKNVFEFFYLGLMVQTFKMEMNVAPTMYHLSEDLDVLLLPINQTCYLLNTDEKAYDALIKIENNQNKRFDQADMSFKSSDELENAFYDYPFVFSNLKKVFSSFSTVEIKNDFLLPSMGLKEGVNTKDYLSDLCHLGLKIRIQKEGLNDVKTYIERLRYELKVIDNMGYNDYFLVVWDFIKYAKNKNIMVGPGRGSAAGSLVSYTLGITNVDPIKYDLLFERFLNPERISMPDIDLDFPDDRRDEVIAYVAEKYGTNRVVSITTFGTFAYRSSIRDICRVLGYTPTETNQIVKIATNDNAVNTKEITEILDLAKQIEGLPRHTGTHPAGVIISHSDLRYLIPLQKGASLHQSQFEQKDLEDMGLLKIDFLGIRNLQIIANVLALIKERRNIDIDINKIPLDDKKTFELLSNADTVGVFQLESGGMRNVLFKLKPENFEDIVAVLALYRPGPMENIDEYIKRRKEHRFESLDKSIDDILRPTFGFIVYQEQIMRIANVFAGYSLAEADLLRRGVSKKDHEILNNERIKFVKKSLEQQHDEGLANKIYDYIVKFADYGFNRSHSVAYAIVAYQMAYLKANYFDVFIAVLLSTVISSDTQVKDYVSQARNKKIKVLPPNINHSNDTFQLTDTGILYPLNGLKGLGNQAVKVIIEERNNGLFKTYDDFKKRLSKSLTDKVIDALIFSSALDDFKMNKQTLFENKKNTIDDYALVVSDITTKTYDEYDLAYLIQKENEFMGFNLVMTPIMVYDDVIKKNHIVLLENTTELKTNFKTIGFISQLKVIQTKQDKTMAFASITDGNMTLEMTIFPEIYVKYENILKSKEILVFDCAWQHYKGSKLILNKLYKIDDKNGIQI